MSPLGTYVLVREAEAAKMSKGGIIMAGGDRDFEKTGKVLSVGVDTKEVKEGDTIAYYKSQTREVTIDHEKLAVINEEDILLVG